MALSEQARAVVQEWQRKHPQDYEDMTWKEIWEELENSRPHEREVEQYLLIDKDTPVSIAIYLKYQG